MFSEKISSGGQRGTDAGSREEDEVDIPENTLKLHILSVVTYFLSIALIHSVKTMFQTLKLIRCSPSLFVLFFFKVCERIRKRRIMGSAIINCFISHYVSVGWVVYEFFAQIRIRCYWLYLKFILYLVSFFSRLR